MRSSLRRAVQLLVLALVGVLPGCDHGGDAARVGFSATRVHPGLGNSSEPLLLNDAITVYFSEPVDPLSVTRDSFAVLDADGHPVRGRLRCDGIWVTFEPEAPIGADLQDGSLRPDRDYELVVRGYPRADGVRARSGRLLAEGVRRSFRTASATAPPDGLPAPLRPVFADSRPFLLRPSEAGPVPIPIDDPRLQLHFTLPVLPTRLASEAFAVTLLQRGAAPEHFVRIEPRSVRLLPRQLVDEFSGSTVELTFGAEVRVFGTDRTIRLQPEDLLGVQLVVGASGLVDYAGRPVPQQVLWSSIVAGTAVTVAEWPAALDAEPYLDADLGVPGFEVSVLRTLRPLVRVEAGSGALGRFRPTQDLVLAPGQPFDAGDGTVLTSDSPDFEFRSIEIPRGVTVHVRGFGRPVALRALGRIHVAGRLVVEGTGGRASWQAGEFVDLSALCAQTAATLIAGSGILVDGQVEFENSESSAAIAFATAGVLDLAGVVPHGSIVATERGSSFLRGALDGCLPVRVRLQPGLPQGVRCAATGASPWQQVPADRGASRLRIQNGSRAVRVSWQVLPADPLQPGRPDLDPARATAPREVGDEGSIDVAPQGFLRLRLQAEAEGGVELPQLLAVRALDR